MSESLLISTAYLPPIEYFSLISNHDKAIIEVQENYIKQTYRNRCYMLSTHGPRALIVPVLRATVHKVRMEDVLIDYSRRWQQVHLGALTAAYGSSPYFRFYFDDIAKTILSNHKFLIDLNTALLSLMMSMIRLNKSISFSEHFEPVKENPYDFRYGIVPGKMIMPSKRYYQVFSTEEGFFPNLSIADLLFNMGPDAGEYL